MLHWNGRTQRYNTYEFGSIADWAGQRILSFNPGKLGCCIWFDRAVKVATYPKVQACYSLRTVEKERRHGSCYGPTQRAALV